MSLKNKSVLVTGGAGFLGSHLIDRIIREEPERIDVVDNMFLGNEDNLASARNEFENLTVFQMSAGNREQVKWIMEKAETDVVFNLAVVPLPTSLEQPAWTFQENCEVTLNLSELQRKGLFDKLVHFSSSEVYGSAQLVPMSESHPLNPETPYAASKLACDALVQSYYRSFGMESVIIRPFNNYGPRQNEGSYAGVIPATIKRVLAGLPPVIYGDGEQTRDYIFVTDTCEAALQIEDCGRVRGEVINIASGKEISVNELVALMCSDLGCSLKPVHEQARAGDVRRHCADTRLAKRELGFKPVVDFHSGLVETIEWYKKKVNK